jgi:metal-responsive CopG/Arc/MetJ family transcriptional regulator
MMKAKRINITIPEENLREINEFCVEEGIGKSQLIREAAVKYIANVKEQKEIEKRKQEIESAIKMMDELRKKAKFINNKTAAEMIRELRDSR